MKKALGILLFVFGIFYMNSCRYDNEEDLYPCGVATVSYKTEIEPLIESKCSPCHFDTPGANDPSPSFKSYSEFRGVAERPSSRLLCRIKHESGCDPWMPLNQDQLSDSSITLIESWINQCYPLWCKTQHPFFKNYLWRKQYSYLNHINIGQLKNSCKLNSIWIVPLPIHNHKKL